MTLIQSAKLNGHDPYAYLKDVLTRLPTQKNNAIDELLPHNWKPPLLKKPDGGLFWIKTNGLIEKKREVAFKRFVNCNSIPRHR